jgi:predicted DNA-binding transcriptional regulator YafY
MNRVDRLVGVLTQLQSRRYVTAEQISKKFGISVRTVYRDIRALDEIGIPVSFENHKGYFIVPGYFLPPVSFNSDEANALVLLSSLSSQFTDQSIAAHTTSAIDKVRAVLKTTEKAYADDLSERIIVLNTNTKPFAYLSDIQQSISRQIRLKIEYLDSQGRKTRREIEPIGLIYYTDQWHMIAWCWLRLDYRDFIVKQIQKLTLTGIPFRKKDHISVEKHIQSWK